LYLENLLNLELLADVGKTSQLELIITHTILSIGIYFHYAFINSKKQQMISNKVCWVSMNTISLDTTILFGLGYLSNCAKLFDSVIFGGKKIRESRRRS